MKKKMAIILSAILACSMSMTVMAAPSPTIEKDSVQNVVISDPLYRVPDTQEAIQSQPQQVVNAVGANSAVLPGTVFKYENGVAADPAYVKLVTDPANTLEIQQAALELAQAMTSRKLQIFNNTGKSALSMADSKGNLNVLEVFYVSLQDQDGTKLSHNGSIAPSYRLSDILGSYKLAQGETIQALYQRADGSWVAVPVVIRGGVLALSLPAFHESIKVMFTVVKGTALEDVPASAAKSPRT